MILRDIEQQILSRENDGYIYPDYGGYCISSIPETVRYIFGEKESSPFAGVLEKAGIAPGKNRKVVVLLLDAFGWDQWLKYKDTYEFLTRLSDKGVLCPITSVFPSITPVAMTTLHSGLTPQEHGIPGNLIYFKELEKIIAVLRFMPLGGDRNDQLLETGEDPRVLFNGETLYEMLAKSDIPSYGLTHASISESAYASVTTKGSITVPYQWAEGLLSALYSQLTEVPAPAYFFAYWGLIDVTGHRNGIHSPEYFDILDSLFTSLRELIVRLPNNVAEETILLVLADHGHFNIDPEKRIFLDEYPELLKNLHRGIDGNQTLPWEQSRYMFLSVEEDMVEKTRRDLEDEFQGKVNVLKTADALEKGFFGRREVHPRFTDRIGDILLLPEKPYTVWYRYPGVNIPDPRGTHGGLSIEEMVVPFAVAKMSDLQYNLF